MKTTFTLILLSLTTCFLAYAAEDKKEHYTKTKIEDTKNVYLLTGKEIYRGGQPDDEGFADLEKKGVKSALNLREYHEDKQEAKNTKIKLFRYKLAAGSVTEDDISACLRIIQAAPKPIFIHCWHGFDRTGVICASYRIAIQNWEPTKAIEEFTEGPFGFHSSIYGNLPKLIRSIDWVAMKKKLTAPKQVKKAP